MGGMRMARQGQKLTDELKEQIRAHLVLSDNISETAKKFGVSVSTVSKIRDEKPDEFEKLRNDKKQQMIDKIWASLVDAAELGHSMIQEAKMGKRDIPLNQISTYYGTLYDKMALMKGENTANMGVSGGLTVVFDSEMG
jgi:transposase-like protein